MFALLRCDGETDAAGLASCAGVDLSFDDAGPVLETSYFLCLLRCGCYATTRHRNVIFDENPFGLVFV